MEKQTTRGFTFVELLMVMAVMGILAMVSVMTFQNFYRASALRVNVQEVYAALIDARGKTLASEDDTVFGVHVGTTSIVRFKGPTYTVGAPNNEPYTFLNGVFATGSLAILGTDVVFARLTGEPSATGTIVIQNNDGTSSSTVTIFASGLIE